MNRVHGIRSCCPEDVGRRDGIIESDHTIDFSRCICNGKGQISRKCSSSSQRTSSCGNGTSVLDLAYKKLGDVTTHVGGKCLIEIGRGQRIVQTDYTVNGNRCIVRRDRDRAGICYRRS